MFYANNTKLIQHVSVFKYTLQYCIQDKTGGNLKCCNIRTWLHVWGLREQCSQGYRNKICITSSDVQHFPVIMWWKIHHLDKCFKLNFMEIFYLEKTKRDPCSED